MRDMNIYLIMASLYPAACLPYKHCAGIVRGLVTRLLHLGLYFKL